MKKVTLKKVLDIFSFKKVKFSDLRNLDQINLYAGDVPDMLEYKGYVGLSIKRGNGNHIKHSVTDVYPLNDNSVDRYQSEDVFEHISYEQLPGVINEIYRVLKKGGLFRLSLPDYKCDILNDRTLKNTLGELVFDPMGGGKFVDGKVLGGGHLWFPDYIQVKNLLNQTNFTNCTFLHYYDEEGKGITNKIDYSKGYVMRTPDHDERVKNPYRPMSIVVDCIKN